jgi:hypothetical protein
VKAQPSLTATNSAGATVPEILYIGAEYCPYCAAQRWATIIALSRFGTFSGLGNMSSYSNDVFPNTPTFTFVKAKYKSKYLVFKSVEEYTNYLRRRRHILRALQKPTAQEIALISKYDRPKYIKGPHRQRGRIDPLHRLRQPVPRRGRQLQSVDARGLHSQRDRRGLSNATEPGHRGHHRLGELPDGAICKLTKNMPGNVCTSSGRGGGGQGHGS